MEGKEQRFGIANSALWATTTTSTSNGSVNAAMESFTGPRQRRSRCPTSAASEVIFGGVGTGLYSMLLFVLLAVFIGGLMVGRTPEYLGKKIQAREIKLVSLGVLFTPLAVLLTSRRSPRRRGWERGRSSPGSTRRASRRPSTPTSPRPTTTAPPSPATPASSSPTPPATSAPTGSASPTCSAGPTMLAPASSRSSSSWRSPARWRGKKVSPAGLGTMRTDNPTFVFLLIGVVILVGALTFFPALSARADRPEPDHEVVLRCAGTCSLR